MSSCLEITYDTYEVINNSSHDITIYGYIRSCYSPDDLDKHCFETIELKSGSTYSAEVRNDHGGDNRTVIDSSSDSVYITFDNEKFISFARDYDHTEDYDYKKYIRYHIMGSGVYETSLINKGGILKLPEYRFTFEFTDEDYEFAEFIE